MANLSRRPPFHIESITKTFTALLLAQMIEAGDVSIDDRVAEYLPEAVGCADVRLVELATHTSGLPQLPDPLPAFGAACPHDPYSAVALLSTDVGRYIAAQLRPGTTTLEAAIEATHKIRLRMAGGRAAALGWVVDEVSDRPRYWHNGGTYGFSAYAAFIPAAHAGLAVVLSQAPGGDGRLEQLGNKLLDALVGESRLGE